MNPGYFFSDLLSTLLHIICLCFYLRILFPSSSELAFKPFFRGIIALTDPVILFFQKNRILNNKIHPLITILVLLIFKAHFTESLTQSAFILSYASFFATMLGFLSFLYKFYVIIFWLVFSADKFGGYSDLFSFFGIIFNRTLLMCPFLKTNSLRNTPFRAFSVIIFLFFMAFSLLSFIVTYLSPAPFSSDAIVFVISFSIKLLFGNIIGLLEVLYFLLLIRIILSWFMPPMTTPLILLNAATEPILAPFRKLPLRLGMIDFSPILVFFTYPIFLSLLKEILSKLP